MKVGKLIIPKDEKRLHVDYTDYVVYSYDRDNFVFRFAFENYPETNGTAYLLIKADDIADQQFNLTITNKRAEWLVPERLLGYEGHVKGYLYLTENDLVKSEDAYMYTFLMRRSELDTNVLELESLYFEKFEDLVVKMDLRVTELLYQSNVVFSEFQSFTALKKQEIANLDVDISADVDVIYQNLLTFYSESKNLMTQEVERVADKKVLTYIEMENLLKSASSSTESMLYNIQEKILEAEVAKDSAVNTMNEQVNQLLQLMQQAETILGGIIRDKIYTKTEVDEFLSRKVTATQVDQAITAYDRDVQIALRDKVSTQSFETFKTTNSNTLNSITDGNGVKEIVNARNDTKGIIHVDLGSRLDTNENLVSDIEVEIDEARGESQTLGDRLESDKAESLARANAFETEIAKKADKEQVDALGNEIILARGGASTLGERLDEEKAEVTAQLAENEQEINKLNPPHKISDLKYPLYVAHRGAMGLYQEHTMIAYESHVLRGNTLIELDVRQSKDGSLFIMHDSSIYRTTNGAGNVSDMTTAYLKNRKITDKLPTRNSTGTEYSYQPEPIPSLNEVLDKFGKSVTYFIESKDQLSASLIAKEVIERNLEKYVVIQSFSLTDLKSIKDEGIEMLYLSNSIKEVDYTSIKQTEINFIGVSASVPDDYVLRLKNAGFKVLVYTVNHRYLRDKFLSLNVDGFFSDEPFYLSETNPVMKVDNFREKLFLDGMIPMYGSYKGEFNIDTLEPHTWGFLKDSAVGDGRDFVLQGYLDKQPNAFSLNVTITKPIHVVGSWASIAVCLQNDYFDDNKNPQLTGGGYHMLFSSAGQMFMYSIEPTGAVKLVEYVTEVNEWKDNPDAQLRITVTDTEVKFERLDIPKSIKVANTKYRGGYIAFGRKNANYLFKNVSIT